MCIPSPRAPQAPAPVKQEEKPMTKEELYAGTPHMMTGSNKGKKAKIGKSMLRTDLNMSSGGSGLNIA